MKEIQFQYKSLSRERKHTIQLPEKINEFTVRQFVDFVRFINVTENDTEKKIMAGLQFFDLPNKVGRNLDGDQILYLLGLLHSCKFESQETSKWFMPNFAKYFGPYDKFTNLSLGEFCLADTYFLAYAKNNRKADLWNLTATLYRVCYHRSNKDVEHRGDCREPFNQHGIESTVKTVSFWPSEFLEAVFYNYALMRQYIESLYPFVFPKVESDNKKSSSGWSEVIRNIAPTVLDVEKVEALNLHLVLTDLNAKIKEQ